MLNNAARQKNNTISWLWSYVIWLPTKITSYFYPKQDARHKRDDDFEEKKVIRPIAIKYLTPLSLSSKSDLEQLTERRKETPPLPSWTTKFNKLLNYSEWAPYQACRRAYAIVAPIIGPEKLKTILGVEFILTLSLNLVNLYIATELAKDKGAFDRLLSNSSLKGLTDNASSDEAIMNMAKTFGYHCALSSGVFLINQAIVRGSELIIKFPAISKLFEKLFKSEDPTGQPLYLSVLSTEGANVIVPNVPQSLGVVIRLGNKSFVSAVNAGCNGIFSAAALCYYTSNFNSVYSNPLIPKIAFSLVTSMVSGGLNYLYTKKREKDAPLVTEIREIEQNNYTPVSYVSKALLGGGDFSVYQSRAKMNNIQSGEIDSTGLETLAQWWSFAVKILDKPLNHFLTAMQILRGSSTAYYPTTLMHLENVSAVTNWSSENSPDIAAMSEHLRRLERFGQISQECSERSTSYSRTFHGITPEIVINGGIYKYEPKIAGSIPRYTDSPEKDPENYKLIYYADSLKIPLEVKKEEKREKIRCLISAPAGLGKSTLLNALHGKSLPGAPVAGTFGFPKSYDEPGARPNIFMVPQDVTIPLHVSFLELLCYPTPITTSKDAKKSFTYSLKRLGEDFGLLTPFKPINILTEEKEKDILAVAAYVVKALGFTEKFDTFFKDPYVKKATWGDKSLSGGEKRVIPLIWAILQNPKILLMDEADANLDLQKSNGDPGRAVYFQKMLHELLPDTSILVISHNDNLKTVDPKTHHFYNYICDLEEHNIVRTVLERQPIQEEELQITSRMSSPSLSPPRRNISAIDRLLQRIKPSESNLENRTTSDYSLGGFSGTETEDVENKFTIAEVLRRARGLEESRRSMSL